MADCKYCKKPAGMLKSEHPECAQKHAAAKAEIVSLVARSPAELGLRAQIDSLAAAGFIDSVELNAAMLRGWGTAVHSAFEDNLLSESEEEQLLNMAESLAVPEDLLHADPAYMQLVKGGVLREVLEGTIPERVKLTNNPFNFQKNEKIVWLFNDVRYSEMRTYKAYQGGYAGFSVKLAQGLYYKMGAFRGHPLENDKLVFVDTGALAVTNLHIYFKSSRTSFRIKYEKMVTFEPYDEGIILHRDTQTAKPQVFSTGDGWFTFNLIANLASL